MQALDETLPILRDDLKLIESSVAEDGSKQWLLYDALQNKYFTIGIDAFNLLSLWENSCKIDEFLVKLKNKNYDITQESLQLFLNFITNNKLVKIQSNESIKKVYQEEKNSKQTLFKWLLHNYLFIRLPLLKPDRWLDDNMPIANLFYSNIWRNFVLLLGFIGIVLTLRNL
ncbi:MAG: peptidase M50, partial [Poseidonibacter sp.]